MPNDSPLPEMNPAFYAPDAISLPAAISPPVEMTEPKAGGNYLRDPVTGVLSLNPDHEIPQE